MKRKTPWFAVWLLATATIMATPAGAQEKGMVDFDDHPANPPGTPGISIDPDFYADRGVRFAGGTVLQYEEGFASSGRNGLEMCYAREFCTIPFEISFDSPQWIVAVKIGYGGGLDEPVPVVMVGFDDTGTPVARDEMTLGPGAPIPVGPELVVEDPARNITSVQIRWSDPSRLMNSLVIDDVFFEQFVPTVEVTAEPYPLVIESTEPVEADIVITNTGNTALSLFLDLDDPTGAFELVATNCDQRFGPGEFCIVYVLFTPDEPGDYEGGVFISVPEGDPLFIPIFGTRLPLDTRSTTAPPTTTESPTTTAAPTTTTESSTTTTPPRTTVTTADSRSSTRNSDLPWILLVAGGFGGGALLMNRRKTKSDLTPRPQPSLVVRLTEGLNDITTDERQPVTAIRIWVDSDPTTTLTEGETS